jgi:ATP-binding cassette, subfamily B, multidrug efflux pump
MSKKSFLSQDTDKKHFDKAMVQWMWSFTKPYKKLIVGTFIFLILAETIPFLFPHILQIIIDENIAKGNYTNLVPLLILYLSLTVGNALFLYGKNVMSQYLGLHVIHDLRLLLYKTVQNYKMRFFHKTPVGRLMTRMTNDVDTLNTMFSEGLIDLFASVFMLVGALIIMLVKDWRLGLMALVWFPLMIKATSIFRIKVRNINVIIRQQLAQLNSVLQESLNGIVIVQLFQKQKERFDAFQEANKAYRDAFYKNVRYYSYYFPTIHSLTDFSILSIYVLGAYLVLQQEASIGLIVAFTWYASNVNRPLREISDRITNLQNAFAAASRILTLLESGEQEKEVDGHIALPAATHNDALSVQFAKVSFYYQPEAPVLQNLSFSVKAGESLAIVGATGSGKSTIMNLINRFYTPVQGEVLINDIPIQNLQSHSMRSKISMVTQDVFLFSDTIRNNITMGLDYDENAFAQAAQQACITHFIDQLPQGYDTILGEEGKTLSTGQRQLLSFARAIYSDPALLLLDEATSSIDAGTEKLVQQATLELMKNRTAIIVAHRLSTIARATNIIVLHQGKIIESGTHNQLLQTQGYYYRMVRMQNMSVG